MTEALIDPKWPRWMAAHVRRYLGSDGRDGHLWHDVPTLLLTTRGARSGEPRLVPLIYGVDGAGRYVVVASHAGAPRHPHWFRNLQQHAEADVQVAAHRFRVRARTAVAAERERLWLLMVGIHPPYADYQKRTRRQIPVVVLEPVSA